MTTKKNNPLVSIIIRTKNEERWIKLCLDKLFQQTYKNFEIIIVDNYSTDKTLDKLSDYNIKKIKKIKNFYPGKAINLGANYAAGEYLAILSAHCIPTSNYWLQNYVKLVSNKETNKKLAGIYGRQEPMLSTNSNDRRDLFLLFGLDKKIQQKDSFFHNANSFIKKDVWKKYNFDEKVKNIEDRIWAEKVLKNGLEIIYDPKPSVYHFHGVHQNNNESRLNNVVRILEKKLKIKSGRVDPNKLKIAAIIPIKGLPKKIKNKFLLEFTINTLKKCKFIDKIIVSTDNKKTKKIAISLGADVPFLRPKKYSLPKVNLEEVQKVSLNNLEKLGYLPDLVVHLEETYPFREENLIDSMIKKILDEGLDTVIASRRESNWLWKDNNNENFERVDSGDVPRKFKEKSMIAYPGICCITYPEFVRKNSLIGKKIGLFEIKNQLSFYEVREKDTFKLVSDISKIFNY